jgi:hypothetical protein
LKANNIARGDEVAESGHNRGVARTTARVRGVVGEAVDIIGQEARGKRGVSGERRERIDTRKRRRYERLGERKAER